jgi:hypothetical protein
LSNIIFFSLRVPLNDQPKTIFCFVLCKAEPKKKMITAQIILRLTGMMTINVASGSKEDFDIRIYFKADSHWKIYAMEATTG